MTRTLLAVAFALAIPASASAQSEPAPPTLDALFAQANRAAWIRDWDSATRGYHDLLRAGVEDPDVYYNLATAYLSSDRLGQAMRFYERSLRLRPGDEDARHNLEVARRALGRRLAGQSVESRLSPGRAALAAFTLDGAGWTFLVFWVVLWTLVLARPFLRLDARRLVTGVVVPIVAGLAILSGALLAGKLHYERRGREAIVVAHERASGRAGPGSEYPDAPGAPEGERVQVLAREGRFALVRMRDGREAWLAAADVGTL